MYRYKPSQNPPEAGGKSRGDLAAQVPRATLCFPHARKHVQMD
jgi:hypothetical protein